MPVSDLPLNLRLLLDTIADNNMLRSWQIYNEKDGVTVKLRFNNGTGAKEGEAQQGNATGGQLSYVRKSPSQQRRDSNRYQQRQTMTTRSQKARTTDTSVEMPRGRYSQGAKPVKMELLLHPPADSK